MKRQLFVYGTLMRGFGNYHYHLDNDLATFKSLATTSAKFTMLHLGGFPGVLSVGDTAIQGELFEIDNELLPGIDRLEGHPNFYKRTPITVTTEDGSSVECETYILDPRFGGDPRFKQVLSGSWRDAVGRPIPAMA